MKRIFILLSILFVGKVVAQTSAYYQDFGPGTTNTFPATWTSHTSDWVIDPDQVNGGGGLDGPNGGAKLVGPDGSLSSLERVVSNPFSAANFSAMTISWNGYRTPGAPTLSLAMSTSPTGPWTNIAFTDVTADNAWHSTSAVVPASFDAQTAVYISFSYLSTGSSNYLMIDDIDVSGTASPIFYWDGVGALNNFGSWWTNPNATGTNPSSFTFNNQIFNLYPNNTNATAGTLSGALTIGGTNSKLNVGDGATGFNFSLNAALTLTLGAKLNVLNSSTLTLQNVTFPSIADVVLTGATTIDFAQSTAVNLWATTYNNLTISGGADKNQSGSPTVSGILNLNGRSLAMGSGGTFQSLTLNGTITGSGTIKTGNSRLLIGGTGAFGTVTFGTGSTAQTVNALIVTRTSGTMTFGSNLTVTGVTTLSNGSIDISGRLLTLNGAITFPTSSSAGNLTASKTTSLTIGGTGAITNNLFLSAPTIGDITLNRTGASLTLGNAIECWGAVTPSVGTIVTGGNLTVKQDASNKGRVGIISSGGFSGNVTAEVYAPGPTTGWALLGANGISGKTMNDWYGQFPMAIEGSATGVTSAGGYFESVQGWNETDAFGYDSTITVSTPLTPAKGFWVYLGDDVQTTSDFVISLTGAPVTGTLPISLTKSAQSGTNLVCNPYASPISWTALRNGNSAVSNAVYIYNANGPYATFVNGVGTNGGSDVLPSGQGFYVEALSATSLVAQETNKVASNTNLMKTDNSNIGLAVKLNITGFSSDYDETALRFHGSATSAFDVEWDARKIFQTPGYLGYPGGYNKYTTISTKGNSNEDYSVNSLPFALNQSAVIPVLVKVMATGQYTIAGQDMEMLPPGACVTLKDKLLNVTHNIKASPYVCTINDSTSAARFELTICADITAGINDNNSSSSLIDQSVVVKHDQSGIDVVLDFDQATKANVSVTNILGQKIIDSKFVNAENETVRFNLESKNQLLFITIQTENSKATKKVIH